MYSIVQIAFSFNKLFKCFSLAFPSFMTMMIGIQLHGSESTDDIIQCLCMDIYSHLQRDNFWECCLLMIQFI